MDVDGIVWGFMNSQSDLHPTTLRHWRWRNEKFNQLKLNIPQPFLSPNHRQLMFSLAFAVAAAVLLLSLIHIQICYVENLRMQTSWTSHHIHLHTASNQTRADCVTAAIGDYWWPCGAKLAALMSFCVTVCCHSPISQCRFERFMTATTQRSLSIVYNSVLIQVVLRLIQVHN